MEPQAPVSWEIPARAYDAMAARAEADYPEETCGLVFAAGDDLEVVPLRNIQNDLHRRDPQRYPRDARTAYEFDEKERQAATAAREAAGRRLRASYHSHPDHDAYFSPTDREAAAPPGWGPIFPGAVYLVLSVRAGKLSRVAGFVWSEERSDFTELAVRRMP
ncbi:MAG: Mov34/MPN/PAD-1 family protein [Thermoanaerobaculia bacterium]